MQPDHVFQWYGEEAVGVRRAEIIFYGKGEAFDIVKRLYVSRMYAALDECLLVEWDTFIRAGHLMLEALHLERSKFSS